MRRAIPLQHVLLLASAEQTDPVLEPTAPDLLQQRLAQVAPAYSQKPFMATGGVTLDNMAAFFDAGAIAVGMGDTLFGRYDEPDAALAKIAAAMAIARNR